MFTAKMNAENDSGSMHQQYAIELRETLKTFTPMNWLFGIGFGYTYAAVFNVVLVNSGLIGMAIYLYAFLKPVLLLRADSDELALTKVGVTRHFSFYSISMCQSCFLPTTWMFLGCLASLAA